MSKYKDLSCSEKKKLIEKAYQLGYEYEQKYGNCPQCTIAAIQDVFGIIDDTIFKSAYGLAAGIGLTSKGNCGALSAGVMIISLLKGRDRGSFQSGRYPECYSLSKDMVEKFEDKYQGILCHEIQRTIMGRSFDLSNPREFEAFENAGGHNDKCPDVVGSAAAYIAELIVNGII